MGKTVKSLHAKTSAGTPHAEDSPYAKRIILALREVMREMDTHSRRLLKHHDITVAQVICLYAISEQGAMTLSILSKNVHLTASTLVGVVDRLEEKGLLKRTRDTEDRRAIFIDITQKGKDFVAATPDLLHNRLDEKLKMLSHSEQVIIANSLDLLVDMLHD